MKNKINWALTGCGKITNKFIIGLRAAGGNAAAIVSRSAEKANEFSKKNNINKAYDNYDLMLEDPDIHAVYIGTPHTTHKDYAVRALKAKKAVLCEKPSAINTSELKEIITAAKENNIFFMEALWNRFTPPLIKTMEWLSQGIIGDIKMVQANFGFNAPFNRESRLYNLDLGGGALLDAGIYPLSVISMAFGGIKPAEIKSFLVFSETGADESDSIILSYGSGRTAYAAASITTRLENDAWIYGTKGKIHLPNFIWAKTATLYIDDTEPFFYKPDFISNGYNYEVSEVNKCLSEGKIESEIMPWRDSLVLMETMDTIRKQWDFHYPQEIQNLS